jgi:hypothetical protein
VTAEKGEGAGWVAAANGTLVTVTLNRSAGASAVVSNDSCGTTGTVGGSCSVTFTSNTAGTITGHAAATIVSGGLPLFRETDGLGNNSGDAEKIFVDARISILARWHQQHWRVAHVQRPGAEERRPGCRLGARWKHHSCRDPHGLRRGVGHRVK